MKAPRDIPNDLLESLKSLGLTKYEALVYIGLLQVTGATATEVHEISGVPRASVYPVLDRLAQKELVSVSHTTPKRFDAIPPARGIENMMRRIEEMQRKPWSPRSLYQEKDAESRGNQELIWTIYGEENIKNRLPICSGCGAERGMLVAGAFRGVHCSNPSPNRCRSISSPISEGRARFRVHPLGAHCEVHAPPGKA